jgi:uncharacterized protein (DUF924 family)
MHRPPGRAAGDRAVSGSEDDVEQVLEFWFGRPDDPGYGAAREAWFRQSDDFDAEIRDRFGELVDRAAAGALDGWAQTARGALALIILLDQFSRNLNRGSGASFASDPKALALAKQAIAAGHDRAVTPIQMHFFYLPFEHAEDLADQEQGVALMEAMPDHEGKANAVEYAVRHRDVIARFGRFPHRNAVLGRETTDEEAAFLADNERGF